MVNDVSESCEFYTKYFGFEIESNYGAIALLNKDDLTLVIAGPNCSAGQPLADGTKPVPGGWNRIIFEIKDIDAKVAELESMGMKFRNEIMRGGGRAQILCLDPSGNVIELLQR